MFFDKARCTSAVILYRPLLVTDGWKPGSWTWFSEKPLTGIQPAHCRAGLPKVCPNGSKLVRGDV